MKRKTHISEDGYHLNEFGIRYVTEELSKAISKMLNKI